MQRGPIVLTLVLITLLAIAGALFLWNPTNDAQPSQPAVIVNEEAHVTSILQENCRRIGTDYQIIADAVIRKDLTECQPVSIQNQVFCSAAVNGAPEACGGNPSCEAIAAKDISGCAQTGLEQPLCEAVIDGTDVFEAVSACEQNAARLVAEDFAVARECEKYANRNNPECLPPEQPITAP